MTEKQNTRKINSLLALVLFGVFSACILSVLLTSAGAYRRLAQRDQFSYDRRTAEQYLTTRIRQADRLGSISVEKFQGADVLVLREETGGEEYQTMIYCCDGYLRELFAAADTEFAPEDGEKVLQAEALTLSLDGRLLTAQLTASSEDCCRITLCLRSGKGDAG